MKKLLIASALFASSWASAQNDERYNRSDDKDYESVVKILGGVGFCATTDSFVKKAPIFYHFEMDMGGGIAFVGLGVKAPVSMAYQEYDSLPKEIIRFPTADVMFGFTIPRRLSSILAGTGGGGVLSGGMRSGRKFYPDAPLGAGGFAQLCFNTPYPLFQNMAFGLTLKCTYVGYVYQRKSFEGKPNHVITNWLPTVEAMVTVNLLSKNGSNSGGYHHSYYYKE